jgi:hypothetical protein
MFIEINGCLHRYFRKSTSYANKRRTPPLGQDESPWAKCRTHLLQIRAHFFPASIPSSEYLNADSSINCRKTLSLFLLRLPRHRDLSFETFWHGCCCSVSPSGFGCESQIPDWRKPIFLPSRPSRIGTGYSRLRVSATPRAVTSFRPPLRLNMLPKLRSPAPTPSNLCCPIADR